MNISFNCYSNNDTPYINNAIFTLNGKEILLDRDYTEYDVCAGGQMDMTWRSVYIIKGDYKWSDYGISADENEEYLYIYSDELADLLNNAKFVKFEIESDAPADYYCIPEKVNGKDIILNKRIDILGTTEKGRVVYFDDISDELDSLTDHLTMNGYSFELYKPETYWVSEEEVEYLKTILDDRNFLYKVS